MCSIFGHVAMKFEFEINMPMPVDAHWVAASGSMTPLVTLSVYGG